MAQKPGYDVIIEAEGGLMSITGERDGPPVKVGVAVTDLSTGLYAHGAILAALFERQKTGLGQKIDVSLLECQVAGLANIASSHLIGGVEAERWGTQHASIVPYQVLYKTFIVLFVILLIKKPNSHSKRVTGTSSLVQGMIVSSKAFVRPLGDWTSLKMLDLNQTMTV
jgi:crotonobetainyl-CoA:carnitine CoA-transferase CaiB-like acyl-CoA transferase